MLTLLFRLAGPVLLLATLLGVVLSVVACGIAARRRDRRLMRFSLVPGGASVAVLCLALAAGPLVAPRRLVQPGAELSFCGFDCHLHVTALGASGDSVQFRLRSDARRAPEFPAQLRIRATDDLGRALVPMAPLDSAPLLAGDTIEPVLRFPVAPGRRITRVTITWGDWLDYLVPGPQNAMVQSRTAVRLE